MASVFDEDIDHNRNLVETVFPVLKERYGEEIGARITKIGHERSYSNYWYVTLISISRSQSLLK
ncbi:hypothetical protein EFE40_06290 [Methanohalophilus halophilus]|uniref:Biopterin-dependent aromatic amino acid hydroxylase family profile domain-containing protein n=1 Tax=Methanohalophilus halophilus TaxID=2177 RepID=A0A3M9L794_9EURY|nr:hypothetical protein EFE40_06290 [Methanohalophilus halophilus]